MNIQDFIRHNASFPTDNPIDQVLAIAWFWYTHENKPTFTYDEMGNCFTAIPLPSVRVIDGIAGLVLQQPAKIMSPELNTYQLTLPTRLELDQKYAHCKEHQQTIEVKKLLTDLLDSVPDTEQRKYLHETLTCFKHEAFRAAIIMAWNLAYDHLCRYILEDATRLAEFNKHVVKDKVTVLTEFAAYKESQVLQWSRAAKIIDKHPLQLLEHALTRRNMAAHPSDTTPSLSNVESTIDDLVRHVIHKHPLQ
jgi:hypothetical protein